MGRPKLKNPMTHKINFMVKPELGDFLKTVAESANVSESELHRHLFGAALLNIIEVWLKNDTTPEEHKKALKLVCNTQILPLLNPVLMSGKF
jgi:hypothetical protein